MILGGTGSGGTGSSGTGSSGTVRRILSIGLDVAIAAFVVGLWLMVFTRGAVLWP